jgi:hypothetical protein
MVFVPLKELTMGNLTTYYHFVNAQNPFFTKFLQNFIIGLLTGAILNGPEVA